MGFYPGWTYVKCVYSRFPSKTTNIKQFDSWLIFDPYGAALRGSSGGIGLPQHVHLISRSNSAELESDVTQEHKTSKISVTKKSHFPVLLSEAPGYGAHRGSAGTGSSSLSFSEHEPGLSQLPFLTLLLLFLRHNACALWAWLYWFHPISSTQCDQLWAPVCQLWFRNTEILLIRRITVSNSSADYTSIPSTGEESRETRRKGHPLSRCVCLCGSTNTKDASPSRLDSRSAELLSIQPQRCLVLILVHFQPPFHSSPSLTFNGQSLLFGLSLPSGGPVSTQLHSICSQIVDHINQIWVWRVDLTTGETLKSTEFLLFIRSLSALKLQNIAEEFNWSRTSLISFILLVLAQCSDCLSSTKVCSSS